MFWTILCQRKNIITIKLIYFRILYLEENLLIYFIFYYIELVIKKKYGH